MKSARCIGLTVGIALVSAGLSVAPAGITPSPAVERQAVELAASPLEPYVDLIATSFANLGTIGTHWLADPLPVLVQAMGNWFGYAQTIVSSFVAAGQSFVDGLANLPSQLQTLFSALMSGDFEGVASMLVIIALSANPIPALVDRLLGIPYDIVGNLVNGAMAALHAAQVPIGLAALSALHATVAEIGVTAASFSDDLRSGDLAGAFVQVVQAPAQILNAALNADSPGLTGVLTPFHDLDQTGLFDAVVNYFPRTVAQAISAAEPPIDSDVALGAPAELSDINTDTLQPLLADAAFVPISFAW